MHVDEDLADPAVLVLAGAQVDLVAADDRLLGIALAALRQALAAGTHFALDDPFDDALGDDRRARGRRQLGEVVVGGKVVAQRHRRQRLRELRAVAIESVGFQAKLPRHLISLAAILDRSCVWHVDGLGDRARYERLCCSHHAYVTLRRQAARAISSTGIRTIEHREMLALEIGRAFDATSSRTREMFAAAMSLRGEAEARQHVELRIGERCVVERQRRRGRRRRPACSARRRSGYRRRSAIAFSIRSSVARIEAARRQRLVIDRRRPVERAVADRVGDDARDAPRRRSPGSRAPAAPSG